MKIKNRIVNAIINVALFALIFSIPLYFIRVPFYNTSLSVLTITMIFTVFTLNLQYYKKITDYFKKSHVFWSIVLLFIVSFIPALIIHPTIHGIGVFIEWISLPIVTGFFLNIYLKESKRGWLFINTLLTILLFTVNTVSLIYFFTGNITFDNRLSSFFSSPNHLALFIAPLIYIALANFYLSQNFIRSFTLLIIIESIIVLFLTNSFGTIVGAIGSFFIIIFIKYKRKKYILFSAFLVSTLIFLVITYHKVNNSNPDLSRSSFAARKEIWTVAINHLQQNIFINKKGIDSFQNIYLDAQLFYPPYLHWDAPTPHNLIATLWVNGGFFTVMFFSLLCAYWLYISVNQYKKTKSAVTLFYVAALIPIIISGFFDTPYWKNDLAIIFWLIIITVFQLNHTPQTT